jgi:voltage-gated potassium channel Kch
MADRRAREPRALRPVEGAGSLGGAVRVAVDLARRGQRVGLARGRRRVGIGGPVVPTGRRGRLERPDRVRAPDETAARRLADRDVPVFTADPSDVDPLERVNLAGARAVVAATEDDARDALAILTARQLNPDVRIVAAVTQRENVDKLRRAGADQVISPSTLGGHILVDCALGADSKDATEGILDDVELGD